MLKPTISHGLYWTTFHVQTLKSSGVEVNHTLRNGQTPFVNRIPNDIGLRTFSRDTTNGNDNGNANANDCADAQVIVFRKLLGLGGLLDRRLRLGCASAAMYCRN